MAGQIHPTAIIEPGAQLGTDVTIGAYAFVGAKVVLGGGCRLHHHANVEGRTTLGGQCEVFPFACIGTKTHDLKFTGGEPGLMAGDRNVFREYVSVHAATADGEFTRLGNDNVLLAYSHIAHDCIVGNSLIMSAQSALAGHVIVEDHVNIGWGTGVHQFCRIGAHAIIGGCSGIMLDIPPYVKAQGNRARLFGLNTVGLKRRNFPPETIRSLKQAYRLLFLSGFTTTQALERIATELPACAEIQHLVHFIKTSERGITR